MSGSLLNSKAKPFVPRITPPPSKHVANPLAEPFVPKWITMPPPKQVVQSSVPVVVKQPAPAPVGVKQPDPAQVVVKQPAPAPVVVKQPAPAPVVVKQPDPAPVVVKQPDPAPVVVVKQPDPAPVVVVVVQLTPHEQKIADMKARFKALCEKSHMIYTEFLYLKQRIITAQNSLKGVIPPDWIKRDIESQTVVLAEYRKIEREIDTLSKRLD
jgi:hypothetical protein